MCVSAAGLSSDVYNKDYYYFPPRSLQSPSPPHVSPAVSFSGIVTLLHSSFPYRSLVLHLQALQAVCLLQRLAEILLHTGAQPFLLYQLVFNTHLTTWKEPPPHY